MIPDFVLHFQELKCKFDGGCEVVREDWDDEVKERFFRHYIDDCDCYLDDYLYGGSSIQGKGIDELLRFFEQQQEKMSSLSGIPPALINVMVLDGENLDFQDVYDDIHVQERNGVIHNENRERDYWDEKTDGSNPGKLNMDDMNYIMEERKKCSYNVYEKFLKR